MYENPVTGAAPATADQLECKTNSAVTKCYGTSFNAVAAVTGADTGSVLDGI